ERQRLDVAHGAADFHDSDVDVLGYAMNGGFDFVGDVRNHLNGFAQIIPAPLLLNNRFVNAAGRQIVFSAELGVGIALVMTEVQVRFRAVVGDIDLAVLVRAHRSRIDI